MIAWVTRAKALAIAATFLLSALILIQARSGTFRATMTLVEKTS